MGKPSASEMKRIKAALKRHDPFTDPMMGLRRRPQQLLPGSSLDQDAVKRQYEQAGFDIDKIKKLKNKRQLKRLRVLLNKRPPRDKSVVMALKSLRHAIQERRRSARRANAGSLAPGQITRVYLDNPFMIQANKPEWLLDSQIETFNSTAHAKVVYNDTIPTDNNDAVDSVSFFFAWQNDTGQDAEVQNCTTILTVSGQAAGQAWAGDIPVVDVAGDSLTWTAKFQILQMWNQPPTSPLLEGEQQVLDIVDISGVAMSRFPFGDSIDEQSVDIFRGFPLLHRNFFVVPQNGSLVFQVSLIVNSHVDGGLTGTGFAVSFFTDPNFLGCPFVEFQVGPWGSMSG